jgi:hypothetical protein
LHIYWHQESSSLFIQFFALLGPFTTTAREGSAGGTTIIEKVKDEVAADIGSSSSACYLSSAAKKGVKVDLDSIVTELKNERDRIGRAIAFLGGAGKAIAPNKAKPKRQAASNGVSGYWKDLSPEQRSAEMKRRAKVRARNRNKGK